VIFRTHRRENPFAQSDRNGLQDPRLSFKARGVWAYLLSKPEDWEVMLSELEKNSPKEGRESLQAALRELKDCGYARLIRGNGRDASTGRISGSRWMIYESPADNPEVNSSEDGSRARQNDRQTAFPTVGENHRQTAFPTVGKSAATEERREQKKDNHIKDGEQNREEPAPKAQAPDLFTPVKAEFSLPGPLATPEHEEAWQLFAEMRKKKKVPMNPRIVERIVKDLLSWGPEAALESLWRSARAGYPDVYPPRANGGKNATTAKMIRKEPVTHANVL
jgi:hypothetical protein